MAETLICIGAFDIRLTGIANELHDSLITLTVAIAVTDTDLVDVKFRAATAIYDAAAHAAMVATIEHGED